MNFIEKISLVIILLGCKFFRAFGRPTAVAVVFYATEGLYSIGIHDDYMAKYWQSQLSLKNKNPEWPVTSLVELVDTKSNDSYCVEWATKRVANTTLPPVSVFIFDVQGINLQIYFSKFQIPCYIATRYPNAYNQNLSVVNTAFEYTFFNTQPPQRFLSNLVKTYKDVGVKTIVYIYDESSAATVGGFRRDDGSLYLYDTNQDVCQFGATQLFAPNGIVTLANFSYSSLTATREDRRNVVRAIQKLDPDAILLCDSAVVYFPDTYKDWIMTVFKELNYLPRALNLYNQFGNRLYNAYVNTGLLEYTTCPVYTNVNIAGVDYTVTDTPYSSYFLRDHPYDVPGSILSGSNIGKHDSSARLFLNWYKSLFGNYPSNHGAAVWTSFEIVEAAMWKAGNAASNGLLAISKNGYITPEIMFDYLGHTNSPTPIGRVVFDPVSHANNLLRPPIAQLHNINSVNIVAPGDLANSNFVYPMPTWDERVYKWVLIQSSTKSAIVSAAVGTIFMISMLITITIHRNSSDVKMLHNAHMSAMLLASIMIFWSLVFVWQGDVTQSQCDAYLWTLYLPGSFVIQLVNMKAYRLSVFLTSESKSVVKKFTHNRVLALTAGWVSVTIGFLLIAAFIDPPTRATIITDPYRPSTNYNICKVGSVTSGILYFLFVLHLVMSTCCVIVVRNGSETFKDGSYMKESFIILFASIVVTFIFSSLGLNPQSLYLLRTVFVGFGFTLFCLRLLLARCLKHWLPSYVKLWMALVFRCIDSYMPKYSVHDSLKIHSLTSLEGTDEEYKIIHADAEAGAMALVEMEAAFRDPARLKLLQSIASQCHVEENVEFIHEIMDLPQRYENVILESTASASQGLLDAATKIFNNYCIEGCEKEVNISSGVREKLRAFLKQWPLDKPVLSNKLAKKAIQDDLLEINGTFDDAVNEIRLVLFQNVWTKFRSQETELRMG